MDGMTLPRMLVDQVEDFELAAVLRPVGDKVPGPDMVAVRSLLLQHRGQAPATLPWLGRRYFAGLPRDAPAARTSCPRRSPPCAARRLSSCIQLLVTKR